AARPEGRADHFVRVRLARERICAGPLGSAASAEARNGEIEAAPEEMHGAGLADELRAELLEDRVDGEQGSKPSIHGGLVVCLMCDVLVETDVDGKLAGHRLNLHLDA